MTWQNNGQSIGAMGMAQNHPAFHQQTAQQLFSPAPETNTIKLPLKALEARRRMVEVEAAWRDLDAKYARLEEQQSMLGAAADEEMKKPSGECDVSKLGTLLHQEHRVGGECTAAYSKRWDAREDFCRARGEFLVALTDAGIIPSLPLGR